eukprot:2172866-Pleurochrysis_carterae.AAC.3
MCVRTRLYVHERPACVRSAFPQMVRPAPLAHNGALERKDADAHPCEPPPDWTQIERPCGKQRAPDRPSHSVVCFGLSARTDEKSARSSRLRDLLRRACAQNSAGEPDRQVPRNSTVLRSGRSSPLASFQRRACRTKKVQKKLRGNATRSSNWTRVKRVVGAYAQTRGWAHQAKVEQVTSPRVVQADAEVGRLDVAVYVPRLVDVLDRVNGLQTEHHHRAQREPLRRRRSPQLRDVVPKQFHHQVVAVGVIPELDVARYVAGPLQVSQHLLLVRKHRTLLRVSRNLPERQAKRLKAAVN